MVGTLPRCRLIASGSKFCPYFGCPVEDADSVKSLFVGSTSTEDHNRVGCWVKAEGTVWPVRRFGASGGYFSPNALGGMIGPEVVHVIRVWMIDDVPAYPPKKSISSLMTQQAWPHRGQGLLLFFSIRFQVAFSMSLDIELLYSLE